MDGVAWFLATVFGPGKTLADIRDNLVDPEVDGDQTDWDAVQSWVELAITDRWLNPLDHDSAIAAIRPALGLVAPPPSVVAKGEPCDLAAFDAQPSLGGSHKRRKPPPAPAPRKLPETLPKDPAARARLMLVGDQRKGKDRRSDTKTRKR